MSVGNFGISEANITGREKKKPTEYMPNCKYNYRRRNGPDSYVCTSQRGLGIEVWAASLFLRVRTGFECPEDNLRELI